MPPRNNELTNELDNGEIKLYISGQQNNQGTWTRVDSYRLVNNSTTDRTVAVVAFDSGAEIYRAEFAPGTDTTVDIPDQNIPQGNTSYGWGLG